MPLRRKGWLSLLVPVALVLDYSFRLVFLMLFAFALNTNYTANTMPQFGCLLRYTIDRNRAISVSSIPIETAGYMRTVTLMVLRSRWICKCGARPGSDEWPMGPQHVLLDFPCLWRLVPTPTIAGNHHTLRAELY